MDQVLLEPDCFKLCVELSPIALESISPHSIVSKYLSVHESLIYLSLMLLVWSYDGSFRFRLRLLCTLLG